MVGQTLPIPALYLIQESNQLLLIVGLIDGWLAGQLSQQVQVEQGQSIRPANCCLKVKDIKAESHRLSEKF